MNQNVTGNLPQLSRRGGQSDSSSIHGRGRNMHVPGEKTAGLNMVEFNEDDLDEDPEGRRALSKVDFSWSGVHCAAKERQFQSPRAARMLVQKNQVRIVDLLQEARKTQVDCYKHAMSTVMAEDTMVCNMPRVRITASKAKKNEDSHRDKAKRGLGASLTPLIFDQPSVRQRFNRDEAGLRSVFKQIYSPSALEKSTIKQSGDSPSRDDFNDQSASLTAGINALSPQMKSSRRNFLDDLGQISMDAGSFRVPSNLYKSNSKAVKMANISRTLIKQSPESRTSMQIRATQDAIFATQRSAMQQKGAFANLLAGTNEDKIIKGTQYPTKVMRPSPYITLKHEETKGQLHQISKYQMHGKQRVTPKKIYIEAVTDDEDEEEAFIVNPADDIPRNKLVTKLAHGLQAFIQRAQKREGFRVEVQKALPIKFAPAPRECASLTCSHEQSFLMGGSSIELEVPPPYDPKNPLSSATVPQSCIYKAELVGNQIDWKNIRYTAPDNIKGRQCHSTVSYNNKTYTFGGCYKYHAKRKVRECTTQVLVFDIQERAQYILPTKGFSAIARKNHCAVMYQKSMLVYGGQAENGTYINEMLVLHLDINEWVKLTVKNGMQPFIQGACCNVSNTGRVAERRSDGVQEGIYFFGGKTEKGELTNRLRLFKPNTIDAKVVHGEFTQIKISGTPPVARYGHSMAYLPTNNSLIVIGGRNDESFKLTDSPFLNDIHLFLLDQKFWLNVKYNTYSSRLDFVGNHCMSVITGEDDYEKILIFGGIANKQEELENGQMGAMTSFLSNQGYIISIQQRSQGMKFQRGQTGGPQIVSSATRKDRDKAKELQAEMQMFE